MGSGKTHCGKKIAAHFDAPFLDLDEEIERAEKKSISNLFAEGGEAAFRKIEAETLRKIIQQANVVKQSVTAVVSCGGGTPCFYENMELMNQHGLTVWMNTPIEVLIERLKKEQEQRPLIAGLSEVEMKNFIINKLKEREFFYNKALLHNNSSDCSIHLIEKKLNNE